MSELLCDGKKREGAKPSKPHLGNEGIILNPTPLGVLFRSPQSFTRGVVPESNDLSLIDKLPPSATYTPQQKSSATLEGNSTSKEKNLQPYWKESCCEISQELLSHTKIDWQDLMVEHL